MHAHLQHYTEPSAEPASTLPLTAATTLLPLDDGTFTLNPAGVPIIIVCTKADLIDDSTDGFTGGPSGMGGMVKSKGPEWEERTDSVMQVLRTICLKCTFHATHCRHNFDLIAVPQMAQVSFTPANSQRHSACSGNMPYICCSHHQHHPPVQRRQPHAQTHSLLSTNPTLSTAIVSLFRLVGTRGVRSPFCAKALWHVSGERHGRTSGTGRTTQGQQAPSLPCFSNL